MIFGDHTWVPMLPDWWFELVPLLVAIGLVGGVLAVWQLVLSTFEPRKRWKQWRQKEEEVGSDDL